MSKSKEPTTLELLAKGHNLMLRDLLGCLGEYQPGGNYESVDCIGWSREALIYRQVCGCVYRALSFMKDNKLARDFTIDPPTVTFNDGMVWKGLPNADIEELPC